MSNYLPHDQAFKRNIAQRLRTSRVGQTFFLFSLIFGIIALSLLIYNVVNKAFTLVAVENTVAPTSLVDSGDLGNLSEPELVAVLAEYVNPNRMRVFIFDSIIGAPQTQWSAMNQQTVGELLDEGQYPADLANTIFADLQPEQTIAILEQALSRDAVERLVNQDVVQPRVVKVYSAVDALFRHNHVKAEAAEKYPEAELRFYSWVNTDFLATPMNSVPELAGLRTAILGSLWMMLITISFAFPIGVGAAIYLEEYANDNPINRLIQLNITNLAGVPSIIYGILGLAVFVRAMEPLTSGRMLGLTSSVTASGRTILSAGLTMGLLILPIIIISAQEAIRAVPSSLREASYGLGATKWQMIRGVLLPQAFPSILTGTILAVSRAFGETAPLVVVGSITRITVDPSGPFSRFTAIPIQIYTWTSQPQDAFRSAAAAAIIVLLVILLSFNSVAIILRNRMSKRY